MNCPKCGSNNTKRVAIYDLKWNPGDERCMDCDYQGYFLEFLKTVNSRKNVIIE